MSRRILIRTDIYNFKEVISMNYNACNEDDNREQCPDIKKFTGLQVRLINKFRMLWEQHDVWTRSTIMSIVFDLPDLNLVIERLLRNPIDFGRVFKVFYGFRAASKFSTLLTEHLTLAAALVEAAKAGDDQGAAEIEKKWYQNADEIAAFLGSINPFWSEEEWREMMHEHLKLVKAEAVDILTGNYSAGIAVYDEIERQTLEMADMMSKGIFKQFPCQFAE